GAGRTAGREDPRLCSDERTKDLLNEKKLRPHAASDLASIGGNWRSDCWPRPTSDQRRNQQGQTASRRLTSNVGVTVAVYRNGLCRHRGALHTESVTKT